MRLGRGQRQTEPCYWRTTGTRRYLGKKHAPSKQDGWPIPTFLLHIWDPSGHPSSHARARLAGHGSRKTEHLECFILGSSLGQSEKHMALKRDHGTASP